MKTKAKPTKAQLYQSLVSARKAFIESRLPVNQAPLYESMVSAYKAARAAGLNVTLQGPDEVSL